MRELTIRRATSSDADTIVRLRLLLQKHVEGSNLLGWRMTERGKRLLKQEVGKALSNRNIRVLLAQLGDETIGFAQGEVVSRSDYTPETVGHISLLYIRRRFRRKGVGRRLIKELCEFYSANRAEHLSVRYMIGNEEAEGFWTRLGFEPIISTGATHLRDLDLRLGPAESAGIKVEGATNGRRSSRTRPSP